MQPALIVVLCVAAAITYGVLHDQITARVCVEYFTVGHDPTVFPTTDPTLLALGWGVIATWWVGLILGLAAIPAARFGRRPPLTARALVRPVSRLMLVSAACAAVAGGIGYGLANAGVIWLVPELAEQIPPEKHAAFLACGFAHSASYGVGFLGGLVVIVQLWRSRTSAL